MAEFGTGYLADPYDPRDYIFEDTEGTLIYGTDLRDKFPPVYNQGSTNTCVAQSVAAIIEYQQAVQNTKRKFTPSRLFIYYTGREYAPSLLKADKGMHMRDAIKAVAKWGVPAEDRWLFNPKLINEKPSVLAYSGAVKMLVPKYERVPKTIQAVKAALLQRKPVLYGFQCFDSYFSTTTRKTGVVHLPKQGEKWRGGHAVVLVGYDENSKTFIFRNSYGERWGDKGYGYIPYEYLNNPNISYSDLWVINSLYEISGVVTTTTATAVVDK